MLTIHKLYFLLWLNAGCFQKHGNNKRHKNRYKKGNSACEIRKKRDLFFVKHHSKGNCDCTEDGWNNRKRISFRFSAPAVYTDTVCKMRGNSIRQTGRKAEKNDQQAHRQNKSHYRNQDRSADIHRMLFHYIYSLSLNQIPVAGCFIYYLSTALSIIDRCAL